MATKPHISAIFVFPLRIPYTFAWEVVKKKQIIYGQADLDHDDGTFFGTMECQWFFTCQPLVSMVFPMVFPLETMVIQCFFTVGPLVSMVCPMVFP